MMMIRQRVSKIFQKPFTLFNHSRKLKGMSDQIGDVLSPSEICGMDRLRNPRLNKGLAFTMKERQVLGIHGLQPAIYRSQEEQMKLCKAALDNYNKPLNKYIYLTELRDRNEKLYFRLLNEHIETLLPIVYTPTVGLACQTFGQMYRRQHGLFVTIHDKGHVYDVLLNWPEPDIKAVVVTDGERILGLGDLGAYGMGIPIGKLALYTALAGIKPYHCLPICLDVGTENEELLKDPAYVGIKQKRVRNEPYDEFIDEFMAAVVKRYGQDTLIQFEDFGKVNAARLLEKYRDKYCTFNDDIQGTAAVVLAGLLASIKVTNKKIDEHKYLFFGAGTAATGIADLIVKALVFFCEMAEDDARKMIFMIDEKGFLDQERNDLTSTQKRYAKPLKIDKTLLSIVNEIKPSVLIGTSTVSKAFSGDVLRALASFNERPIVFALSNPTSNAECTAEEAYENTNGSVVFSSGSPFPEFKYKDKIYKTGQGNNAFIFPGVALGVILGQIHHISEEYFLIAARTLAEGVSEEDLAKGSLYPPVKSIPKFSIDIAEEILEVAYSKNEATFYPEPPDKREFIMSRLYSHLYSSALLSTWEWPTH